MLYPKESTSTNNDPANTQDSRKQENPVVVPLSKPQTGVVSATLDPPDGHSPPENSQPIAAPAVRQKRFPTNLFDDLGIVLDQFGKAVARPRNKGNHYVYMVGGRPLNKIICEAAQAEGSKLSKSDLKEINEGLQASAELTGVVIPVWRRFAPAHGGGIEIDVGDEAHTRVKITANRVEVISSGSETLFFRPQHSRPMVLPAEKGDIKLLKRYVNLDNMLFLLLTAWLSYTIAHPKTESSKYPILVISGSQGTGKSFVCRLIKELIDPSEISIQLMPTNVRDLSIASQQSHVLCFDNMRQISQAMSDALCVAASGGAIAGRQLYSDAEQVVIVLHVALVLNGIHSFVEQPDLAQRCLPLYLTPINDAHRLSESDLLAGLQDDLPVILRGLFDLIAKVLECLPEAKVTDPERMIDFSRWIAAMELADGVPAGIYQGAYSSALHQGQLDALLDNMLAASVLEFAEQLSDHEWSGTPAKLLNELNAVLPRSTLRARDWPDNPIALSKRLLSLQAGLLTQGVRIEFGRGKERTITIMKMKGKNHD